MGRTFDIDAPLLIAGHPIVATERAPLARWLKRRLGFFARERARWRGIEPAEVLDVREAPNQLHVRTKHGEGWLAVRGDCDAVAPGTWVLVDVRGSSLVDASLPDLPASTRAGIVPDAAAEVESIEQVAGHWSVRATWVTPTGLRVRARVQLAAGLDPADAGVWPGSTLAPLTLVDGRPHVAPEAAPTGSSAPDSLA